MAGDRDACEAKLGVEGEDLEAADHQLVAIFEPPPLRQLAVDEDAVEAPIVEYAQRPARFGNQQGVAA